MARADDYKPYPTDAIRNSVQLILDSSISFNNVLLLPLYLPEEPSPETYSSLLDIPDLKAQQIYITNKNVEKIMNDEIDKADTKLKMQIDSYLEGRK